MYSLNNLRRIAHPSGIRGAFNHFVIKANQRYHSRTESSDTVDVIQKEWDNLLILDACRYDMFEKQWNFGGELRRVRSPASWSWGFLKESFAGRELHDTVYITANPYTYKLPDGTFHAVVNLLERVS